MACTFFAGAQRLEVSAAADKQQILIGERLQLTLEGRLPAGSPAGWITIDTLPHFEILERGKVDSQLDGQTLRLRQQLTLTSWDSGRWRLPALTLGRSRTRPIEISVTFSTPFDPAQPYHDVKEPIDVPKPPANKWIWYLLGALLLVVLFVLFFPRSKKGPAPAAPPAPPGNPYREALQQLDQLKEAPGDARHFHTELTAIFRTYLHRRRGLPARVQTTDDLAVQLGRLSLPEGALRPLVQALRLSDVVKFARYRPSGEESEEALFNIKKAIDAIEELR